VDITPQWSAAVQLELIARLALSLGLGAVVGVEVVTLPREGDDEPDGVTGNHQ